MSTYTDTFKTFSEFVCDYYILNIVQATGLLADKELRFSNGEEHCVSASGFSTRLDSKVHQAGPDTDGVLCPGILRHYFSKLFSGIAPRQGFCLPGSSQAVYRQTVRELKVG